MNATEAAEIVRDAIAKQEEDRRPLVDVVIKEILREILSNAGNGLNTAIVRVPSADWLIRAAAIERLRKLGYTANDDDAYDRFLISW